MRVVSEQVTEYLYDAATLTKLVTSQDPTHFRQMIGSFISEFEKKDCHKANINPETLRMVPLSCNTSEAAN